MTIRVLIFLLSMCGFLPAVAQIAYVDKMDTALNKVEGISLELKTFESFGLKKDGEPGLRQTLNWLKAQYQNYGYSNIYLDSFKFIGHTDTNINLVVDKTGTDPNSPWIIVCSHYDTKAGPGVNDNGTGVVGTLQIARIISTIPTRYNVRFIHFAAEEDGLIGSQHYVQNSIDAADSVRIVLNLDQLGGTVGSSNNILIVCERDEDSNPIGNNLSSWMHTDTMAELVELYTDLNTVIDRAFASDYIPFEDAGYVITGLWQYDGLNYPFYHQPGDSLVKVDTNTTIEVIKGALATVIHYAQTPGYLNVSELEQRQRITIYPNPNAGMVYLPELNEGTHSINVINQAGVSVHQSILVSGTRKVELPVPSGYYTMVIESLKNGVNYYSPLIVIR